MGHILLVADRKTTIDSLTEILERQEHELTIVNNQRRALQQTRQVGPDLIIVDMTSPRLSGDKVCEALDRQTDAPILTLVREAPLNGLAPSPADGWLAKPYSAQELLETIHRLLHRSSFLSLAEVMLDLRTREVHVAGRSPTRLTPKQFALLRCLMLHPNKVLTRAYLMQEVWETNFLGDTRTLDVHIRWLREKIEPDPGAPVYIQTLRGIGYRFVVAE